MDEIKSLIPSDIKMPKMYDNSLAVASEVANKVSQREVFRSYKQEISENTKRRQENDLESFCAYLEEIGISRAISDLISDPYAWEGIEYGLVRGYVKWLLVSGYSIGTINVRLATIRQYCRLAGPKPEGAGVIPQKDFDAILTVKGYEGKKARNVDSDRKRNGEQTRKSTKKADAIMLKDTQAIKLKKTYSSEKDKERDALIMGLFIEHALRCSEVAELNVEHINIETGRLLLYRRKTHRTDTHNLQQHTEAAAKIYLAQIGRTEGPLFLGIHGERISTRVINSIVRRIGQKIGISKLSPHDLRHFWAFDALHNGTPLDKVKSGGGWESDTMVLRYAKRAEIANEGVRITKE